MARITPQNLHRQKLSDIFESVYYDLLRMKDLGIGIKMSTYIDVERKEGSRKPEICSVCLGGAAVCGFLRDDQMQVPPLKVNSFLSDISKLAADRNKVVANRLESMANMFDDFRSCGLRNICTYAAEFLDKMIWTDDDQRKLNSDFRYKYLTKTGLSFEGFFGTLNDQDFTRLKQAVLIASKVLRNHGY